jgi:Holliday junction resolvasome RuvABC ATP-dependent DNA helicase subunit
MSLELSYLLQKDTGSLYVQLKDHKITFTVDDEEAQRQVKINLNPLDLARLRNVINTILDID